MTATNVRMQRVRPVCETKRLEVAQWNCKTTVLGNAERTMDKILEGLHAIMCYVKL